MVICNQIMTLLSMANVRSILRMLRPEKSVKDSRCCSKSPADRLLTIDLTGPMEVGAIDRWRKPNPINAMASKGSPAISPQSDTGTFAFKQVFTKSWRKESAAGDIGSYRLAKSGLLLSLANRN